MVRVVNTISLKVGSRNLLVVKKAKLGKKIIRI